MTKISAQEVNKLRKQTGAGMMDCKKALVEANGDFDTAIDLLRKKGQKVAAKRGDRDSNEGLVIAKASETGKKGVLIVLNCETDFVAKNDDFNQFANTIAEIALTQNETSLDSLKANKYDDSLTIDEKIIEQTGVIGEKIELSSLEVIESDTVVAYNHPGNRLAAIVAYNKEGEAIQEAGKQVAMQVAAMDPVAVSEDGVSKDVLDKEMALGREIALKEGKPENIVDKIAEGKVKKFLKENTLLNQQFIRDNKKTVSQFLNETASGLTVTEFKRIMIG